MSSSAQPSNLAALLNRYQLRTDDAGSLVLVGGHEFNATWLQELREPLPERHKAQQLDGTQTHTAQQQAQTSTGQQQNSTDSHTGQQQDGSCQADAAAGLEGHPAATVPQADAAASCEVGAAAAGAPAGQLQQQEQQQQQQKEQELQQQQEDEQQEQEQQRQQQQQQQRRRLPAVVPRVIVELLPRELGLLLGRPGPAVERLVGECEARGYGGLVLEVGGCVEMLLCNALVRAVWCAWLGHAVQDIAYIGRPCVPALCAEWHLPIDT